MQQTRAVSLAAPQNDQFAEIDTEISESYLDDNVRELSQTYGEFAKDCPHLESGLGGGAGPAMGPAASPSQIDTNKLISAVNARVQSHLWNQRGDSLLGSASGSRSGSGSGPSKSASNAKAKA